MFIDSVFKMIQTRPTFEEFEGYLREIRESSEIMMQRDPEIMKQKQIVAHTPSRGEDDDADNLYRSNHTQKRIPIGGDQSNHGSDAKRNAGEGSSGI